MILFGLISILEAQQPRSNPTTVQPPPQGGTTLDQINRSQEMISLQRQALLKAKISVPSTSVVVEGCAIHIPEPPLDAKMAKARLREVRSQAMANLAFLDLELKILYKEQADQIQAARSIPKNLGEGLDSKIHEELWTLLREKGLAEGEKRLVETMKQQLEFQDAREERDQPLLAMAAEMAAQSLTLSEVVHGPEAVDKRLNGPHRAALAWQGGEFLKGIRPSWEAYQPHLEAYIQESSRLLAELEARPQPLSTQLLGRLLKVQLFERCRTLIDFNSRIWALSAAKVLTPPDFHDATNSALPSGFREEKGRMK